MNEYNYNLDNKYIKGKNKKLLLLVGVLLLAGGISLAYYVGTSLISGTGSSTSGVTATINGSELHVEGTLNYTDDNFYPGHKMVSAIKVTATGDNELIPYNLIWNGTNSISSLNYTVYKTGEIVNLETTCEKHEKVVDGSQELSETCTISNIESLGTPISSGSINKNDTKVILKKDEFINAIPSGITMYYYVILEYPNLDIDQSSDIGASITGEVTVEKSDVKPDINIMAVYVKGDNGEYTEQNDVPEGYQVNTEMSSCSNGANPSGVTPNVMVNSLTTTGTSCYLYLDKETNIDRIIADATTTKNDFSKIADTDEGTFLADDPMYGENAKTTYYRGAVINNWVKFGGHFWRIIRKNGDGTLRLIYTGTAEGTDASKISNVTIEGNGAVANGVGTIINETTYMYVTANNGTNSYPAYAGWTYKIGAARPTNANNDGSQAFASPTNASTAPSSTTTEYRSTAYEIALAFFNTLPATDRAKIADGKFCNDRTQQNGGEPIASNTEPTYYFAAYKRLQINKSPSLACSNAGDVYATKVGLITADEAALAGSVYHTHNQSYYLYTGQYYWTISPYKWYYSTYSSRGIYAFVVDSVGSISGGGLVTGTYGIRPVINLKSDTKFSEDGTGTYNNPYVVI